MSKTIVAVEHDNPTFFENDPQLRVTGDVRLQCNDIPDAEDVLLMVPGQGFSFSIAVGERWDCAWLNILDIGTN